MVLILSHKKYNNYTWFFKNIFLYVTLYHFYFNFILLYTQVMLILILINVRYSKNVVFSFEKGLHDENLSSSGPHHPIKKTLLAKFPIPTNGGNPPNPY